MNKYFDKPNATGRDSGKVAGRLAALLKPPKGESFVWLTKALLASPPIAALSVNGWRLLCFLLIEHASHAGRENGQLMATYDQLEAFGLSRRLILKTIQEMEFLGLLDVEYGGRQNMTNQPSKYRLTFYADSEGNPATNQWKSRTKEQITRLKLTEKKLKTRRSIQIYATKKDTTVVDLYKPRTIDGGKF